MVETLLENICIEIGATDEMFMKVVKAGIKNTAHKKYFEQILATMNYLSFKKLMVKRNKELELEALESLHVEGVVRPEELQAANFERDQADLEHAIAMSIAADEERLRLEMEEEEMIRKVMESSAQEFQAMVEEEKKQLSEIRRANQTKDEGKVARMEEEQKRNYEEQVRAEAEKKAKEEEQYRQEEERRSKDRTREEETRKKVEAEKKKLEKKRQEEEKEEARRREAKRIEEDAKKRESESQLPPVTFKKAGNVDLSEFKKLDVSSEIKESEELDAINKKIAEKYQEKKEEEKKDGVESLQERTARLKRQREILLKKKQEERADEMQKYISNGGTDLSVKKELGHLPPIVSQDVLDKRREILNKIKNSEN